MQDNPAKLSTLNAYRKALSITEKLYIKLIAFFKNNDQVIMTWKLCELSKAIAN